MISRFHAAAIERVDGARLVGVFDPVPEAAERAAHAYGTRRFDSLEEMLACREAEAVCVCTPNGLHAPIALKALDAGRHVVIEKPMALTLKDADEIARAALRQNLCVSVISQLRFSPAIQAVKRALAEKRLGKVVSASLAMKYWRDSAYYASSNWRGTWAMDGGGALMNQGIHGVDLLQYLAGPVRRLTAVCKTQTKNIEVEDSAAAVLEFESGAVGTLEGSTTCRPGYPRRLEICGDLGSVVLEEEGHPALGCAGRGAHPAPAREPRSGGSFRHRFFGARASAAQCDACHSRRGTALDRCRRRAQAGRDHIGQSMNPPVLDGRSSCRKEERRMPLVDRIARELLSEHGDRPATAGL